MRIREAVLADAGPMSRVHVDAWRTTYAGIVPAGLLAGLSYRDRESRWEQILTADRPAESNFVAETGAGVVVGFAGGGPEREGNPTYRGELYGIYLLAEYQRKGLGRRLVSAVARRLLSDGFGSMLVWVLADNHPACPSTSRWEASGSAGRPLMSAGRTLRMCPTAGGTLPTWRSGPRLDRAASLGRLRSPDLERTSGRWTCSL